MNRIRCHDCGMSLSFNPGDFRVKCHMCGKWTVVSKETIIPSIEDYYDVNDYRCDCGDTHVSKSTAERKSADVNLFKPKSEIFEYRKKDKKEKKSSASAVAIIAIIIFIIFIIAMTGGF